MGVLLLALPAFGADWSRNATNTIAWSSANCGVPGGIPTGRTQYVAVDASVTTAQLNTHIDNCPSNAYIYFPAGVYTNITGVVHFDSNSGITLKGAGPGRTIILSTAASSAAFDSDQYGKGSGVNITSGYSQGSTSLVMSDASTFSVGEVVVITQTDESGFVYAASGTRHLRQRALVIGKSGNTLTLDTPVMYEFSSAQTPQLQRQNGDGLRFTGIEDMTISNSASANIFWFDATYACWFKNVEFIGCDEAAVWFTFSLRGEVRRCYAHDTVSDDQAGYGVYLYDECTGFLVEDNIFASMFCGVLASSCGGNAILYNYSTNSYHPAFAFQAGNFNCSHGPHGVMTLWEGNITEQFQNDGYHGSTSHQMIFRNYIHGLHPLYTGNRKMIDLTRFSYWHMAVGNVLGSWWATNASTVYEMSGEPDYTQQPCIYRLGYPNVANNDTNSIGNPITGEPTPYPDGKVSNTFERVWNYDFKNLAIVNSTSGVPASLYHSSKPSYWGYLTWPGVSPDNVPLSTSGTNTPAAWRYNTQAYPFTNDVPGFVFGPSRKKGVRGLRLKR